MNIKDAYIVRVVEVPHNSIFYEGIHCHAFRRGQRAIVKAIVLLTISSERIEVVNRPCFEVEFADGELDYVCISDCDNYRIWFD